MTNEELLDTLSENGVDVDNTLERFMGNTDMYIKFAKKFTTQADNFTRLREAVEKKDYDNVLKEAHAMKGVALNLGMVQLGSNLAKIVADVRANTYDNIESEHSVVEKQYQELCDILNA